MTDMTPCPVVSFDIGCPDLEQTKAFYESVFGWSTSPAKHNLKVEIDSKEGINGNITSLGHEPHQYVMIYIQVENIENKIEVIKSQGGSLHIGPLPTGYGQMFAWIKGPANNMIGIISNEK